jgi:predicted transcriptional regulator of viral defense system
MLVDTYRRRLATHAADQYGYVTTRDAVELKIPPVELPKLAATGGLSHVAYGLWRFDDQPRTGRDQFMEAVLRVGADAYLTHDAVLAFHELAQVNPQRIRLGTPHRVRAWMPDYIEIVRRQIDPADLTVYEGVPSATVAHALIDCRGIVMRDRLLDAVAAAKKIGLLRTREAQRVLDAIGHDG